MILAIQQIMSLAGCSKTQKINELPTTGFSSTKDVRDYYKAQMNYDNVVTRTSDVNYTSYEKHSVDTATSEKILAAQKAIEQLLSQNVYDPNAEGAKFMDEQAWAYFKSDIEDKELYDGTPSQVTEADGFYFVDVLYKMKSTNAIGSFTNYTPLVGINGAFVRDSQDTDYVEPYYLASICTALNNYYIEQGDQTRLSYDGVTFTVQKDGVANVMDVPDEFYDEVVNGPAEDPNAATDTAVNAEGTAATAPGDDTAGETTDGETAETETADDTTDGTTETPTDGTETPTDGAETPTDGAETPTDGAETPEESGEVTIQEGWDGLITDESVSQMEGRENPIDINVINSLVGASLRSRAYLPRIDLVYTVTDSSALSGWAIYPQGSHDLVSYGYDRNGVNGECLVRYVFKQDLDDPTKILGYNAYVVSETNNYGIENSGNTVFVADYVTTELQKVIERWDRAVVNNDLPGMQSGNLLSDMGMGIDYAYKFSNGNIIRRMSTMRKVLGRNTEDNTFLLDVETYTEEGSKSSDVTGTYISEYYVTVKQIGQNFYITDWALQKREMQREPDIHPDKQTQRRLVALNLSGDVSDATREEIRSFMADYYLASNKLAGNDYEYTNNGTTVTKRGLYSLVDNDKQMLDEDARQDMLETIVNYMQKNGGATNYVGSITEWIGGTDTQVEIQTEELWVWKSGTAEYQSVYYLLSHMEDQWVLDQRTVLSSQIVDTGIDSYLTRIQADAPQVQMTNIEDTSQAVKTEENTDEASEGEGNTEGEGTAESEGTSEGETQEDSSESAE